MVRGTWPEKKMRKNIITDYAASIDNLLGDVKKDAALVLPVLILDEQGNIRGESTREIGKCQMIIPNNFFAGSHFHLHGSWELGMRAQTIWPQAGKHCKISLKVENFKWPSHGTFRNLSEWASMDQLSCRVFTKEDGADVELTPEQIRQEPGVNQSLCCRLYIYPVASNKLLLGCQIFPHSWDVLTEMATQQDVEVNGPRVPTLLIK